MTLDPKNRLVVAMAVTLLIVAAMFTSFGRSLFMLNTPSVVLPSLGTGGGDGSSSAQGQGSSGQYQQVEVTPETVQAVIATLSRTNSYYRELTAETFWEGGSSLSTIQVWADGGWFHTIQALPSGAVRHDLVGEELLYYWYDGSRAYQTAPADQRSSDLAQRIPTYETVLELDTDTITQAGYEVKGELPCVFVETEDRELELVRRYWISVDNGLLAAAETWQLGQLTYQVTALSSITSPCPSSASFQLPDGTLLHSVS